MKRAYLHQAQKAMYTHFLCEFCIVGIILKSIIVNTEFVTSDL
jgi:hypothetical protein